jgi:glycosyltransferase involved in cell wall biosynthesis
MMKLLVVSHSCFTSVNQSFYADLEEETGWSVTLVVPSSWKTEYGVNGGSALWPGFRGGIRRLDVLFPGDIAKHLYRHRFTSLLRVENPDAIYVHHEPYGLATAQVYLANQLTRNLPIGFYAAQNILKRYPFPIPQMEQWVFRNSSFAFPVTHGAFDVLRKKHYESVAEILPLSVNLALYRTDPARTIQQRHMLGISSERIVFGYVGRLVAEKGIGTLLSALELLQDVPWDLLLVGSGPLEEELRERVMRMGSKGDRVKFIGYVPHEEAPRWLALFDVLILPSETRANWKEQFGRVLVESMACGTPVIGSDSGEIPHIIEITGGGLVFPEGNAFALAEALRRLAQSAELRASLAAHGQRSVASLYDQRRLVGKFASVIEAAVSKRNELRSNSSATP